jgi:methyl-accepting chemotaxis protein
MLQCKRDENASEADVGLPDVAQNSSLKGSLVLNIRISTLVAGGSAILAALVGLCATSGVISVSGIGKNLAYINGNSIGSIVEMGKISTDIEEARIKFSRILLESNSQQSGQYARQLDSAAVKIGRELSAYKPMISDSTEQGQYDRVVQFWNAWKSDKDHGLAMLLAGNGTGAQMLYNGAMRETAQKLRSAVDTEIEYNIKLANDEGKAAERQAADGIRNNLVLGGVAILMAFAIYLIFRRRVTVPLTQLREAMESMAQGNLDCAVPGIDKQDEIGEIARAVNGIKANAAAKAEMETATQRRIVDGLGSGLEALAQGNLRYQIIESFEGHYDSLRQSFNTTVAGLENSMSQVAHSAQSVNTGSNEIRAASEDLARRTEQQAAALEETTAAMGQVTSMVGETARSASDVRSAVSEAHKDATEGGNVVRKAVDAMDAIEKSSQEINNIINVIDGISFQTNLLALNAGVEAARAGDAGKGFAVVANEVRALAQRSADAAKDIKGLITTSSGQVNQGVNLVGETGRMLERISGKIGEINALIADIASGAERQAVNLQQVNGAVTDMDRMTQQNAAMVEESTAAARSLAVEADELAALVTRFELKSNASPGSSAAPARRAAAAKPVLAALPKSYGNLAVQARSY